ncbi:MAG TPA: Rrf2 family transcriptional regulator [Paenalcaligenes sp.]|nr:Rrf2 family transcriptional regulator [Paenalcaligenes sp.]
MQLTQHTDYAFRVLLYSLAHPERLVTITEIATFYDISRSHLAKVVANLTQHGYLIGVRGQKGGLKLGKAPEEINLGVLVSEFEPLQIAECFDENNRCVISPTCKLKGVLYKAKKAFIDTLHAYSLADIALSSDQLQSAHHQSTHVFSFQTADE